MTTKEKFSNHWQLKDNSEFHIHISLNILEARTALYAATNFMPTEKT